MPPKVLRALVMARSSWRSPCGKKKRRASRISATRSALPACFARLVAVVGAVSACFVGSVACSAVGVGSAAFPCTASETGPTAAASSCRNSTFCSSRIYHRLFCKKQPPPTPSERH